MPVEMINGGPAWAACLRSGSFVRSQEAIFYRINLVIGDEVQGLAIKRRSNNVQPKVREVEERLYRIKVEVCLGYLEYEDTVSTNQRPQPNWSKRDHLI